MSKVEKLSIALTPELAEVVRVAVDGGDYASSSEVIREALRDWTDKRQRRAAKLAELQHFIQEGIDSGPPVPFEPVEEILARNHARLKAMREG
jgi:antitoxin ParD1/3/4